MKIYTKTGDNGETSLFGGRRVVKHDNRVEAYGTVDELSSFIGLTVAYLDPGSDVVFLTGIQEDLWKIMAFLSGSTTDLDYLKKRVLAFEKKIDTLDSKLPQLRRFILPGGTKNAALFHVCRVVCRRAERRVTALLGTDQKIFLSITIKYLNRLSDLLFVYARWYAKGKEVLT